MNPSMADEEQAYNEGLKQGIRLIGAVVDRKDRAETLIRTTLQRVKRPTRRSPISPTTSGCASIWPIQTSIPTAPANTPA